MAQNPGANIAGRIIGYARVSSVDQNLSLQLEALGAAGCARVFKDKISGRARKRPGLDRALRVVRAGDALVVWRLDRLGRNALHLLQLLDSLRAREVEFRSLTEAIDTRTPWGKMHYTWASALAELERDLIEERVRAGVADAKKRNVKFGRPRLLTRDSFTTARAALDSGQSIGSVAKSLGCSRNTLKRALRRQDFLDFAREHRQKARRSTVVAEPMPPRATARGERV